MKKTLAGVALFLCALMGHAQTNPITPGSGQITAVSGNGHTLATVNGAVTSGDCGKWDANGNLIDSGAACGSGGGGGTASPLTSKLNSSQLPHWAACTGRVKMSAGNCRVYMIGDSTTFGLFSTNTSDTGDVTLASYPTRLSQYFPGVGMPSQRDSFMGDGEASVNTGSSDGRLTLGTWSQATCATNQASCNYLLTSTGGSLFTATATGSPLTFTPTDKVNQFVVWYSTSPGAGSFSYSVDGGSATTVNENSTASIASVTVAAPNVGFHKLNLNWVSGSAYLIGVEASDSTSSSVQVINAGWPGSGANSWASNSAAWNAVNALSVQAPDLCVISLGINDWTGAESASAYQTNLQAVITACKTNSDVVLVTPAPSANGTVALTTQQTYVNAMYALAATNNVPLIDNWARWQSYERMNPSPFSFYNQVLHPSANGYSDFAQSVGSSLSDVVGSGPAISSTTLLARQVLASATATVTFSGISQSYNSLRFFLTGPCTTVNNGNLLANFNGDATSSDYYINYMQMAFSNSMTPVGGFSSAGAVVGSLNSNQSSTEFSLLGYSTSTFKSFTFQSVSSYYEVGGGLWTNSAGVSSIAFSNSAGGNFNAGCVFSLYGIS